VKKLSNAIQRMGVAACVLATVGGTAYAQAAPQSKVLDLMAQAKAQIQGQVPAPAGQQGGALAPTGKAADLTMDEAVAKALEDADKRRVDYAVIVGERELKEGAVMLKSLAKREQTIVLIRELVEKIRN